MNTNTKSKWVVMLLCGLAPAVAMAQDVNNPTGTLLGRPLGPSSEPGVMVNGQQAESVTPSADPNRSLEGRATTPPRVVRKPQGAADRPETNGRAPGARVPQAGDNK